jgi:hypothetical protein
MKNLCALLLASAGAVAVAQADVVDVNYLGTGAGAAAKISFAPVGTRDLFTGQLRHHLANGTGLLAAYNGDHITFCPDLYQYVDSGVNQYSREALADLPLVNPAVTTMGALRAAALNTLFANYGALASGTGDNEIAQAFQLAVWEIVYDYSGSGLDLTSGDLSATQTDGSPLAAGVQGWLIAFDSSLGNVVSGEWVIGIGNPVKQDQLFTPAPGAIALMGAAGLIGRRRRA